jgi:hypothetical protein
MGVDLDCCFGYLYISGQFFHLQVRPTAKNSGRNSSSVWWPLLSKNRWLNFPLFRCERHIFKLPNVQPRQEVSSTEQFNAVPSLYYPESMVSGSDGYIDAHAKVEPIYEELDHKSSKEVSYDVPPVSYVNIGGATVPTTYPVPPHFENAKN